MNARIISVIYLRIICSDDRIHMPARDPIGGISARHPRVCGK